MVQEVSIKILVLPQAKSHQHHQVVFQECPNIGPQKHRRRCFPLCPLRKQITAQKVREKKKKKGSIPSSTIKDLIGSKIPVFSLRTGSFFAVVND